MLRRRRYRAGFRAGHAVIALLRMKNTACFRKHMALFGADLNTSSAVNAFLLIPVHLRKHLQAFRIVAPVAMQIAPLEENHGAYPRAIGGGEKQLASRLNSGWAV